MKTKATIKFIELLRPDSYWPQPYSLEQAFHIFQWMVETAESATVYGTSGPIDLLTMKPSCINHCEVGAITSIEDLRLRFHYAVLSSYASHRAVDWRDSNGISVTAKKVLTFRHHDPFADNDGFNCEDAVSKAVSRLFHDGSTKRLIASPNRFHPTAKTCKSVQIGVSGDRFTFSLKYGWPDKESTSSWFHELAHTKPDEPFLDGLARALTALDAICVASLDTKLARRHKIA